ncbi:MAG TPA: signal recognition particle-docking protein FtsY [Alphaproteobacteria bacterium]|nr:signal recognition particle-docking protein FtsY [Alphaproteobacteria bacterium]
MGFFNRIKQSFTKTSDKISEGLNNIFIKKKLDGASLEELEELLIAADIGVKISAQIIEEFSKKKFEKDVEVNEVKKFLAEKITDILKKYEAELQIPKDLQRPYVIEFVGVNGSGKTTTIGKFASSLVAQNNKVMIAACDTFRAAAEAQLEHWAGKAGALFFKGVEKQDPASVAYQAYEKAKAENVNVLLIDTAGRLQNKQGLMEELAKISRTLKKHDAELPDKTILIIDAITGQNGLLQAEVFKEFTKIDGLIITKLDGTAKGGIAVAIAEKFNLPIFAVGVGEGVDDLKTFTAENFANSLIGINHN